MLFSAPFDLKWHVIASIDDFEFLMNGDGFLKPYYSCDVKKFCDKMLFSCKDSKVVNENNKEKRSASVVVNVDKVVATINTIYLGEANDAGNTSAFKIKPSVI